MSPHKKYVIAVDCEGLACVVGAAGASLNRMPLQYEFARRQATAEASAAARGLFARGADQVITWDNHSHGCNMHYHDLDERCDIFLGSQTRRFAMLDSSFTGVLFVGYHSKDNTIGAPVAHTFSSENVQWIKINGQEVGELAIDAAVAGTHGVPPLLVVSDDKTVAEARGYFPGITTVETKIGYSYSAALSKHPVRVLKEIEEAAKTAAMRHDQMKPFSFDSPLTVQIRYTRIDRADKECLPEFGRQRVDAYTVERKLNSITDMY